MSRKGERFKEEQCNPTTEILKRGPTLLLLGCTSCHDRYVMTDISFYSGISQKIRPCEVGVGGGVGVLWRFFCVCGFLM